MRWFSRVTRVFQAKKQPNTLPEGPFRFEAQMKIPRSTQGAPMIRGDRMTLTGRGKLIVEFDSPNRVVVVPGKTLVFRGYLEEVKVEL